MIRIFIFLVVSLASSFEVGADASLEDLDKRLKLLENKVEAAGVSPLWEAIVQPKQPIIDIPKQEVCVQNSEEMISAKSELVVSLEKKGKLVNKLAEDVTEIRRSLLKSGCGEKDHKILSKLNSDYAAIKIIEDHNRSNELLDCVNQKILMGEREKKEAMNSKTDNYKILGLSKRLDALNAFSSQMLDLSKEIASTANLLERLEKSLNKLNQLCEQGEW
jgi:hypothetical protein